MAALPPTLYIFMVTISLLGITHSVLAGQEKSDGKSGVSAEKTGSVQSWNSWTPVSENSSFWLPPPNTTPLSHPVPTHYQKPKTKQKLKLKAEDLAYGLEGLRSRAMSYGNMVLGLMGKPRVDRLEDLLPAASSVFHGSSEHSSDGRSALGWLTRLIGVEGKTLGEFLREYQVHVLYDLAFTFFKWVFFLYAGLLIP